MYPSRVTGLWSTDRLVVQPARVGWLCPAKSQAFELPWAQHALPILCAKGTPPRVPPPRPSIRSRVHLTADSRCFQQQPFVGWLYDRYRCQQRLLCTCTHAHIHKPDLLFLSLSVSLSLPPSLTYKQTYKHISHSISRTPVSCFSFWLSALLRMLGYTLYSTVHGLRNSRFLTEGPFGLCWQHRRRL